MYVESGGDEGCERGEGVGEYDCYVSAYQDFHHWK